MNANITGGKPEFVLAIFRRDGSPRTAGAVTSSNGGYTIADTATTAQVGDIYRPETATVSTMVNKQYKVIAASTNSFTIASKEAPTLGDTFYILGPSSLRTGADGGLSISVSGLATEAKQDTQITSLQLLDDAVGTDGAASPTKGYAVGGTDGTNFQIIKTDTSGRPDVTINSSALPSGAATEAKQDAQITSLGTINTSVNALLKPADTLTAVTTVGAVTQITNALPAGDNNIGNVDIVTLPALPAGTNNIGDVDVLSLPALPAGTNNIGDVDVLSLPALPAGTNNIGDVDVLTLPAIPSGSNIIGRVGIDQTTPGTTNLVALAANQSVNQTQIAGNAVSTGAGPSGTGVQRVKDANVASATLANVASSATNVTLQASNSSRTGLSIFNDSTSILYVKLGATASTSSYTVQIASGGYYELPQPIYSGIVDGIWSSANGNARMTEW